MRADSPTVSQVLRRQASARGEHPLLVCDAERISYGEAERRSALLARTLVALGAGKGTHVGLLYPNGVAFLVAMLAAARIGAVVVPFSTFVTASELREQLVDSDVEILLAAPSYRSHDYRRRLAEVLSDVEFDSADRLFSPRVPQLRRVLFATDDVCGLADDRLLTAREDDVDRSDPLAIIYTSGTTSAPKGVVHTHAALLGHQKNLNEIRGLTADDKLFCNSPFFWIGGFGFAVLATLVAGCTLVCSNATDAAATLDLLEAERPTITNGFVAGVAHLARHPSFAGRDLSSMRRGNLYPIMAPEVRPADPELRHNMLGLTEAGSVVLLSGDESDQPENRRGSFGKPAPGFDMKVIDQFGREVQEGELGELCLRGPYLMQRYYKRSREECFDADGWFHTGDLVAVDRDGFVYFIRRRDSMIKAAGANVSPAEVEKAITKVTGGAVAHVLGIPDPERGQVVAAVVAVDNSTSFDEAALREKLRAELSTYKIPKRFAAVRPADIPLLASGKVDLRRLQKVFDD
ncbi:class I adenylate-forming enzyme family protein [Mycobacterium branderi]|uniref:AMP-binding protein n=1 Tax=Mycobacterium branderi TaxID=43348 RepID=A0A7I7W5R7_9MYCO|nr:class I adenylate-forming enzyme family protein [Mycobacterium branderi]MCV7235169.1 acyl--CoA ligase [Mycobacterium branderi]ORA33399.1 AMP-binding protein [Mycobacterium branderi]BBZ12956.1 AMP-binding protein [Mycobacterium branderi]